MKKSQVKNKFNSRVNKAKPLLADMHLDGVRFDNRILAAMKNEETYNNDPIELLQKKPGE